MKRPLTIVLAVAFVLFLVTQLQPALIRSAGGVAGSFGVRPVSHQCFGLVVTENDHFPSGEFEFTMVLFHFRYSISHEDERSLCIGQDIWYGE